MGQIQQLYLNPAMEEMEAGMADMADMIPSMTKRPEPLPPFPSGIDPMGPRLEDPSRPLHKPGASRGPFDLLDPAKTPSFAKRYRRRMPSLLHLKANPCTILWQSVMTCYVVTNYNQAACAEANFAFEECKKTAGSGKQRVSAARFHLKAYMRRIYVAKGWKR